MKIIYEFTQEIDIIVVIRDIHIYSHRRWYANPCQQAPGESVTVFSCSVVSASLQPHGMQPARLLPLSVAFSRQEYWSGLPCPSPKHQVPVNIFLVKHSMEQLVHLGQ